MIYFYYITTGSVGYLNFAAGCNGEVYRFDLISAAFKMELMQIDAMR